jgi:hypothetical protein
VRQWAQSQWFWYSKNVPRYPYKSKFRRQAAKKREGVDYVLWRAEGFDLAQALASTSGELLELGGPSFDGYYFLDDMKLPRRLRISNLFHEPFAFEDMNQRARKHIGALIDARELPYNDNSLGLVLAHYLSYALDARPHTRRAHESEQWRQAMAEMAQTILGQREPQDAKTAQRVQMWREAYRVLEPGGLLITDGRLAERQIMQQIGFIPKAILVDELLDMEEVVLQKPASC